MSLIYCYAQSPMFPDNEQHGYICTRLRWHRGPHYHSHTYSSWEDETTWRAWYPHDSYRLDKLEAEVRKLRMND